MHFQLNVGWVREGVNKKHLIAANICVIFSPLPPVRLNTFFSDTKFLFFSTCISVDSEWSKDFHKIFLHIFLFITFGILSFKKMFSAYDPKKRSTSKSLKLIWWRLPGKLLLKIYLLLKCKKNVAKIKFYYVSSGGLGSTKGLSVILSQGGGGTVSYDACRTHLSHCGGEDPYWSHN